MSTANRVLKNTLILYAKTGVTMFLSLYTTRVVLRELGADGFGVFALIGGIIAMFGFLNGSMAAATQRFMSYAHGKEDDHEQQDIFSISLVLHSAVAVIAVLLLLSIGPLLFAHVLKIDAAHLETARILYNVVALSIIFPVMAVPYQAVIIARENMLMLALVGFLESLLKFGIAIYITHASGDKLLTYGILMAAIPAILMLTQGLVCHARYTECRFGLTGIRNRRLTREMLSFGGWSFLGSATSFITQNGRGIVLNSFFGTTVNAAQGITKQITGQLGTLTNALKRAIEPVIIKREGASRRQSMLAWVATGSKVTFLLRSLVAIPVLLEMEYVFSIWLVEIPKFTVEFCKLFLINNLIEHFSPGLSLAIHSVGKIKTYQIVSSMVAPACLLLSILAFYLGAPPIGIYVCFIFSTCLCLIIQIIFCAKLCSLKVGQYIVDVLLRSALTIICSLTIGYLTHICYIGEAWQRFALTTCSSMVSVFLFFWLINLNATERAYMHTAILSLSSKIKKEDN